MSINVCVVYHSGYGHTAKQAEAVAEGAAAVDGVACTSFPVDQVFDPESEAFATLDSANAIIIGCPTYMGSPSADMKRFMEASSGRWMENKKSRKVKIR